MLCVCVYYVNLSVCVLICIKSTPHGFVCCILCIYRSWSYPRRPMPLIFIGSLQLGWAAKSSQTSQTCLSWLAQMVCGKTSQTCFSCLGLHRSTPPPLSFPPHIHLSLSLSLSLHSSIPPSLFPFKESWHLCLLHMHIYLHFYTTSMYILVLYTH